MNAPAHFSWDGGERRRPNSCRRIADRRSTHERRHDPRTGGMVTPRGLFAWLRALTRRRLGVDRRKNPDQRKGNRRMATRCSLLTREELADLLR